MRPTIARWICVLLAPGTVCLCSCSQSASVLESSCFNDAQACDGDTDRQIDADSQQDAAFDGDGTAADRFVGDRELERCDSALPSCPEGVSTAGCELDATVYAQGQFPGARRVLVTTSAAGQTIRTRLLFTDMVSTGSTVVVRAWHPDCRDSDVHSADGVDVFEQAGDDHILEHDLQAGVAGLHTVEIYTDCAADYLLTIEVF